MSNVIYIETTAQVGNLLIALPVGDIEYHEPYKIVKIANGREVIRDIRDSKYFTRHLMSELPESINEMFDYKRYKDHAYCFYKEVIQDAKKEG